VTECSLWPCSAANRYGPNRIINPAAVNIATKNPASGTVYDRVKSNPTPISKVPAAPASTNEPNAYPYAVPNAFNPKYRLTVYAMTSPSAPIPIPIKNAAPSAIFPAAQNISNPIPLAAPQKKNAANLGAKNLSSR